MKTPLVLTLAVLASTTAYALDLPQRKAGLWEMQMEMENQRNVAMPPMKQCIDEKTDIEIQKRSLQGGNGQANCSKQNFSKVAGGWDIDSVCKFGETTTTTHSTMRGDFQSAYVVDAKTHYDPAMHGMTDGHVTVRAKWTGACPAGMRGGDTTVNGRTFNVLDLQAMQPGTGKGAAKLTPEQMKQMMEMMKKQQAQ